MDGPAGAVVLVGQATHEPACRKLFARHDEHTPVAGEQTAHEGQAGHSCVAAVKLVKVPHDDVTNVPASHAWHPDPAVHIWPTVH